MSCNPAPPRPPGLGCFSPPQTEAPCLPHKPSPLPPPQPLGTPVLSDVSMNLPILAVSRKRNHICPLVTGLSHSASCLKVYSCHGMCQHALPFLAPSNIPLHVYATYCLFTPVYGRLGHVHLVAVVSNAAVTVTSVWASVFNCCGQLALS